ncbi:MAG TPA: hypothetical protein ENN41_03915, partial [Sediminispirochaeta sp.]|nr:hypothetical protein [Sediminispirochaeta sp.]
MKMKTKAKSKSSSGNPVRKFGKKQRTLILMTGASYIVCLVLLILATQLPIFFSRKNLEKIEFGQVAEYDITAETDISFTDKQKTEDLRDSEAEKVAPVYT